MLSVGVDEVGRGCWAGPLVACAVILDKPVNGLKDSKLLTKKQRIEYCGKIKKAALYLGVGWVEPKEIDELGLSEATSLAMQRAIEKLDIDYDEIIVDGNINYLKAYPKSRAVIKADNTVPCVSAASIVAKVERDSFMENIASEYPMYSFELHVGYGTKLHLDMLKLHGVSKIHRLSYKPIKLILNESAA
jgi:ribonuclease HII